jgi:uncharacterized membrane protein
MEVAAIALGTTLILLTLLIPGFALTFALFPRTTEIKGSERFGLAFVFGLVPQLLSYFLAKNASIPINETTTYAVLAATSLAGVVIWQYRLKQKA